MIPAVLLQNIHLIKPGRKSAFQGSAIHASHEHLILFHKSTHFHGDFYHIDQDDQKDAQHKNNNDPRVNTDRVENTAFHLLSPFSSVSCQAS